LTGHIVARFEAKGFKLADAKLMKLERDVAEEHYEHLRSKAFFGELVDFITSGPVFAMVLEGKDAVKNARSIIGATNPSDATPGTIRGDYAIDVASNIVHGSDSDENAQREIDLYFH
jgi:nucleoside-diphosphate kinase